MPRAPRAFLAALALLAGAARAQTCFANVGNGPDGNAVFDVAPGPPRPMNISSAAQCTCGSYASSSCCTDAYVTAVKSSSAAVYKGWSFDQCGRIMGASCRAFMQAQECSYGCDPRFSANYSAQYNDPNNFQPIKLCGSYCDAWFEACKNELTCSSNWQTWFIDPAQGYVCNATPVGAPMQTCKTIGETFVNAQGLCGVNPKAPGGAQGMWGTTYSYAADNQNCISLISGTGAGAPPAPPAVCAANTTNTTTPTISVAPRTSGALATALGAAGVAALLGACAVLAL